MQTVKREDAMPLMNKRTLLLIVGLLGALSLPLPTDHAYAQAWPQRAVKFIVPFGPGAGADIGARLFADKLAAKWGQPVVIENRPGGDSIVAITAFLSANDDHVFYFGPAGSFTVHPFVYSKLSYDSKELIPFVRASNTILAIAVAQNAPYNTIKEFTEAARKEPGKFNSGLVSGITEFTFWGYEHAEGLKITQVPYRDINVAPVDLGENRIHVVMASLAIVQPQWQAGRIKLIAVNNRARAPAAPNVPTAREAGYPSLEVEGLVGLFGIKTIAIELKEKITADFRAVAADGSIAERLKATGQIINIGGPKEFADAIDEQRAKVAATVKAINFKPKQ
jgi:tripartite-type tricarboxylate transporter receptor subunit TctC